MQIEEIHRRVLESSAVLDDLRACIAQVVVGQDAIINKLLIGILSGGHVLIEGVPGLAKTLIISTLAQVMDTGFNVSSLLRICYRRISPDLDLQSEDRGIQCQERSYLSNFILSDEINSAPSKVESGLLEAMQEHQVTIGDTTYPLPSPFFVMATQNPIEHEGTYPLPEAQVDRFMLKLKIKYPSMDEERLILDRMVVEEERKLEPVLKPEKLGEMRSVIDEIYMEAKLKDYILHLVQATRHPERYPRLTSLKGLIEYGASPRAVIYMARAAKANAYIEHRGYVIPDDIKAVGRDVLRHRVILSYEAEAEQLNTEEIVARIFDEIEVP
jgi:MoxR-like ATPase